VRRIQHSYLSRRLPLQWSVVNKKVEHTVTWPDGASDVISKRRMPIQVTRADSMTARRAVAYLREFFLPFWHKFITVRFVHLSCCTGGQSLRLPRTTNKITLHDLVYDPTRHQRVGEEHGPAPSNRDLKSDRQQRFLVKFFIGIDGQVLAVGRQA
jgi:hypothetical protein